MAIVTKTHVLHVPGADQLRDENVANLAGLFDGLCVHEDNGRRGVVWNWAQMLACMAQDSVSEWSIQLDDDAMPYRNTPEHLSYALAWSPRQILGLAWQGRTRGVKAVEKGVSYAVGPHLVHGLAVAYNAAVVQELAEFAARAARGPYPNDDVLVNLWAHHVAGFYPALVARSLFGALPVKSLLGRSTYPSALYTVANDPWAGWSPDSVLDMHMARSQPDEQILRSIPE
jgi:hypothetical protein